MPLSSPYRTDARPSLSDCRDIDAAAFPHHGSAGDKLRFLLGYAILAPSNHNTQPWRFELHNEHLELFADRTRSLPAADPFDRELTLSCGAALGFLRSAAAAFGCRLIVTHLPSENSDLLAHITVKQQRESGDPNVLNAILNRRTNRNSFDATPVSADERASIDACFHDVGVHPGWIDEPKERERLVRIIMDADKIQFENSAFLRELAAWVRPPLTSARDGIPSAAVGISGFAAYVAPLVIRTFDIGGGKAARDGDLAQRSPGIVVLSTPFDTPREWLACGEALGIAVLTAEQLGLKVSYLNQACEVSELRFRLSLFDTVKGHPQLILRLGRTDAPAAASPRRPIDEIVFDRRAV